MKISTQKVQMAFLMTIEQIRKYRYEFYTPEILLYNIIIQQEFQEFCSKNDIQYEQLEKELTEYNESQDRVPEDESHYGMPSAQMIRLMAIITEEFVVDDSDKDIDTSEVLCIPDLLDKMCELDEDNTARYLLTKYLGEEPVDWYPFVWEAYQKDYDNYLAQESMSSMSQEDIMTQMQASAERLMERIRNLTNLNLGEMQDKSKANVHEPWEDLMTNLNTCYKERNPLIGRQKELDRCIRILCRKDKNNPLFIGEPGVGKTALIYGLARRIDQGTVPEWLQHQTIYVMDMASILAGTSYHGEFEKRMKMILEGAKKRGNCILYIDEIHTICNTGGGNQTMNAGEMLKPYLEDGSIRFIGSTTYQDYNKHMANMKAIARRFGQIDVKEPSVSETLDILRGLLPIYEAHHGVRYDEEAIHYAVEQSDQLIHDRFLPDKAIDIIDEAGAYRQQNPLLNKKGEPKAPRYQKVGIDEMKAILTEVCRIDAKALKEEGNIQLKDLDKRIAHEIYGQDDAIRQVVRSVMMSKAGLLEPDKPLASLLFVGPTGVGKTEVCKVLARELGVTLLRFDMSEYTEKHTISKLIGSPAGYVGYDEGGLLTDAIRKTPNCVLLLDEIEKAHQDIYNILLQVMDYARLTDNKGNKADFRNVILVMTSNAGAQFANQASVGFAGGQSKGQAMMASVKKTFKPEFLNRLSGTVVFNDMDRTMASLILDKKLQQLQSRLEAKAVTMRLQPDARDFLLKKGYNTLYGAREMDRVIQQYLTPLLMQEILFGRLAKGGEANIILQNDGLAID